MSCFIVGHTLLFEHPFLSVINVSKAYIFLGIKTYETLLVRILQKKRTFKQERLLYNIQIWEENIGTKIHWGKNVQKLDKTERKRILGTSGVQWCENSREHRSHTFSGLETRFFIILIRDLCKNFI